MATRIQNSTMQLKAMSSQNLFAVAQVDPKEIEIEIFRTTTFSVVVVVESIFGTQDRTIGSIGGS
jgi:hypothetical protein